jgi:hypothetical protein
MELIDLPDDLMEEICLKMSLDSLYNFLLTNKHIRLICKEKYDQRKIELEVICLIIAMIREHIDMILYSQKDSKLYYYIECRTSGTISFNDEELSFEEIINRHKIIKSMSNVKFFKDEIYKQPSFSGFTLETKSRERGLNLKSIDSFDLDIFITPEISNVTTINLNNFDYEFLYDLIKKIIIKIGIDNLYPHFEIGRLKNELKEYF